MNKVFLIDIDGTICDDIKNEESHLYATANHFPDALKIINKWYDDGNIITFFTARENKDRIITDNWLKEKGFKYHGLLMDKPRIKNGQIYHWIDNRPTKATTYKGTWTELIKTNKEIEDFDYSNLDTHEVYQFDVDDKKPDNVVWTKSDGYSANIKHYPTNLGAPSFDIPNMSLSKTAAGKKMIDVFDRETQELIEKAKQLKNEYDTSMMVWESIMSFEPIVGHTYYLYNFEKGNTLSLLSPSDWNKGELLIGAYTLTSENKWLKK